MTVSIARKRTKEITFRRRLSQSMFITSPSRVAMNLDKLIHNPFRLGILTALAQADSLSFRELMSMLGATYGNFGAHARKLENANYIRCMKSFEHRVPLTNYRLTSEGHQALAIYLETVESLIRTMRNDSRSLGAR